MLGGQTALWSDHYCEWWECHATAGDAGHPRGCAWYLSGADGSRAAQFATSALAMIFPRSSIAAGSFWNYRGYGTFRLNFHRFDRFELDLRGHIHVQGAAFSCLPLKWADMVLFFDVYGHFSNFRGLDLRAGGELWQRLSRFHDHLSGRGVAGCPTFSAADPCPQGCSEAAICGKPFPSAPQSPFPLEAHCPYHF